MSALIRIAAFLAAAAPAPAALAAEALDGQGRRRLDARLHDARSLHDDPRDRALLRRHGQKEERALDPCADDRHLLRAHARLVRCGLFARLRAGQRLRGRALACVFLNGLDINSMSGSIPTLLFVCFSR